MAATRLCRLTGTTEYMCKKISESFLNEWNKFLEEYEEKEIHSYHIDKALIHHISVYKRKFHHKLSFAKYEDGEGIKHNMRMKGCSFEVDDNNGSNSLCSSMSSSVLNEWRNFIDEYDLVESNADQIVQALKNYMQQWLRTPI